MPDRALKLHRKIELLWQNLTPFFHLQLTQHLHFCYDCSMTITLNNEPYMTQAQTIAALAHELDAAAPGRLVFEHNGAAVPPSQWEHTRLANGDRIEALKISAGG